MDEIKIQNTLSSFIVHAIVTMFCDLIQKTFYSKIDKYFSFIKKAHID